MLINHKLIISGVKLKHNNIFKLSVTSLWYNLILCQQIFICSMTAKLISWKFPAKILVVYSLVDVLTPKKQLVAALHAYKKEFTQSEVYKVTKNIYYTFTWSTCYWFSEDYPTFDVQSSPCTCIPNSLN